jgi:hypothetical protein
MPSTDRRKKKVAAKPRAAAPVPLCRYEELAIRENRAREAAATKGTPSPPLIDRAD